MQAHLPCSALLPQLTSGSDGIGLREGEDFKRDSVEADELRLAELGRKTVEMYAIAHIFNEGIHVGGREAGWVVGLCCGGLHCCVVGRRSQRRAAAPAVCD